MTEEQYKNAGKIMDELNALKKSKSEIEYSIRRRNDQIKQARSYGRALDWLMEKFATLILEADSASLSVRYECARPIEIPVDQEFVSLVMEYLDKRIDEKTQQLSEL